MSNGTVRDSLHVRTFAGAYAIPRSVQTLPYPPAAKRPRGNLSRERRGRHLSIEPRVCRIARSEKEFRHKYARAPARVDRAA